MEARREAEEKRAREEEDAKKAKEEGVNVDAVREDEGAGPSTAIKKGKGKEIVEAEQGWEVVDSNAPEAGSSSAVEARDEGDDGMRARFT